MNVEKRIMPGVTLRYKAHGAVLRYYVMIKGARFTKTSPIPPDVMLTERNRPTRELKADYDAWVAECRAISQSKAKTRKNPYELNIPSIDQLLDLYDEAAWKRSLDPDWQRPGARTIECVERNYRICVEESGLAGSEFCTKLLDRKTIKEIFERLRKRVRGVTAWTYIASLQSITAAWAVRMYADRGYEVPSAPMPDVGKAKKPKEYRQLQPNMRSKIEQWYAGLKSRDDPRLFLAASMTYQLAMRPNDVGALKAENFQLQDDGYTHLVYTPHKTAETSNRRVDWPIPPELWKEIQNAAGERLKEGGVLLPHWRWVYTRLNRIMREECGMPAESWTKAAYELRKLCIDTVYHTCGADHAVSISGDRRDTIERYYSDPYKISGVRPLLIAPVAAPQADGG